MKKGEELSKAFAEKYRGKLASLGGAELAQALKDYEAISDLLGRTGSYAQLYYVGDTTDSKRGKFYGDVSAKLTEISTLLLFFELELNRIDDAALEKAMEVPALAHYRPWIENLRKEKPYQLDDKLEELFLEKSQTVGCRLQPPVRRDDGGPALRGRRRDADAGAHAEPDAEPGRGQAQGGRRRRWPRPSARTSSSSR